MKSLSRTILCCELNSPLPRTRPQVAHSLPSFLLSVVSRKRRKTSTTLTRTSLRKSPPSRQSTNLWSLPSTRRSSSISPSPRLNCWRALGLLTDTPDPPHSTSYSPSCSLTAKNDQVFQAVTFPNPVRHSACREVSHAQHTNQDCSARTPKHCCDSRNTILERLLKTKWCFYCVLSWLLKDLFTRQLCSIFFSSLGTCCTKVYNIRVFLWASDFY